MIIRTSPRESDPGTHLEVANPEIGIDIGQADYPRDCGGQAHEQPETGEEPRTP